MKERTEKLVVVTNNSARRIAYTIPDLKVRRVWFKKDDRIEIPVEELRALKMIPGGQVLLDRYLKIEDKEIAESIVTHIEQEYFYGDKEIENLLYEASDSEFLDAMDFAPEGVISIIRQKAIIKTPNTMAKIVALNKRCSINLLNIQEVFKESLDNEASKIQVEQPQRRATPTVVETAKEEKKLEETSTDSSDEKPKYRIKK